MSATPHPLREKDGEEHIWAYQEEELEIADLQSTLEALAADEFTDERPTEREEVSLTVGSAAVFAALPPF